MCGRVRRHAATQPSPDVGVHDERRKCLADRMFVRSVIKRGVDPSGAAEFEAVPAREEYESGDEASAKWAQDMLEFADDNFNDSGIEVRSMDSRDCKVGLFGDFLERVGG